jgi:hypothetical protein
MNTIVTSGDIRMDMNRFPRIANTTRQLSIGTGRVTEACGPDETELTRRTPADS